MVTCIKAVFPSRRADLEFRRDVSGCLLRSTRMTGRRLLFACVTWAWVTSHGMAAYVVDFEGETETKTGYAAGDVTLSGLEWRLTEALIGTLVADKKNGERALRIRRSGETPGVAEMQQDKAGGIGTISLLYARYSDETGQPNLYVEYSTDGGNEWRQAGLCITNFPVSLTEWTAEVNVAGDVRVRLRTDCEGTNERRINIDDIVLTHFCDGTPLVTTAPITGITPAAAQGAGEVLDDRGSPVTVRGVVWSVMPNPTTNDNVVTAGTGTGAFTAELSGLTAGRQYYVRAFAENDVGVGYGAVRSFSAACFTNAPLLHVVTNRHCGGFTATWQPLAGAAGYLFDVASDNRFHAGGTATVFRETMGEVEATTTIGSHDSAGGFDNSGFYVYCSGGAAAAADVRLTRTSSGYTDAAGNPASGGANVWFTGTEGEYGFCIGGIDPRLFTDLRLSFAYRKESANRNAVFTVAWSDDGGAAWHSLPLSGMPAADAVTGWYLIEDIALPIAAAEAQELSLRWVKSGSTAMRIDDVLLQGDGGAATLHPRFSGILVDDTSYRVNRLVSGLWWIRVRAVGDGDCVSSASDPQCVETTIGGSVIFFR